ncbi:MAG: hypothetical protein K2Y16_10310 [Burkholderiales bacterium]|nr:hypothetical protein [Burkholderiales bacterium]
MATGKKPLQAVCAVMRKLLHAIHGMLKHNQPFDNTRFYAIMLFDELWCRIFTTPGSAGLPGVFSKPPGYRRPLQHSRLLPV